MNKKPSGSAALSGIRVLDLTSIVFGPYASQTLADYGADVIKIESPSGDSTRTTGPSLENGLSVVYLGINRNKRSLVLDLKQEKARNALLRLVDTADVFMHSMRPQKMQALGLDPESLLKRNPSLIYAGLYGFGEGGTYAGYPAYDDTIQGLSGTADMVARQTGTPRYLPTIAADKTCGLFATQAILAALYQRTHTGKGQFVEIPMFETMAAFNLVEHFYGRHLPATNGTAGYARTLSPYRRPYKTRDGYVCLMPYTDAHWQKFFSASGNSHLGNDARFTTIAARTLHIDELYELVDTIVATRSTNAWLALCKEQEIPATRMNRLEDLETDPHLQSVNFFVELTDASGEHYRFVRNPVTLSASKVPASMPPRLGEHSLQLLQEAGLNETEISSLVESGATTNFRTFSTEGN
jgi:crotonobetainyl-CoA:carnitine CoA-transferase CaiB-like acyl-CoA transferase